jgi:outer membrane lipoprotein SlyB
MKLTQNGSILALAVGLALVSGCSTAPQLYPNEKYNQVGKAGADRDVNDCEYLADQYVQSGGAGDIAKSTGVGAGIGAAGGAALGAVTGSAGTGAALGAIIGGGAGAANKTGSTSDVKHRFVNRCLADRGYDVIGWS